jgi:hypothetical protein
MPSIRGVENLSTLRQSSSPPSPGPVQTSALVNESRTPRPTGCGQITATAGVRLADELKASYGRFCVSSVRLCVPVDCDHPENA